MNFLRYICSILLVINSTTSSYELRRASRYDDFQKGKVNGLAERELVENSPCRNATCKNFNDVEVPCEIDFTRCRGESKATSPPNDCGSDLSFDLYFTTDRYGGETFFKLKSSDGKNVKVGPREFADNQSFHLYACLSPNACYNFTMADVNGDGMCCNYTDPGVYAGYELVINGVTAETGSAFNSSDSIYFGDCKFFDVNETESSALFLTETLAPSSSPTGFSSAVPSAAQSTTGTPTLSPTTQSPSMVPTAQDNVLFSIAERPTTRTLTSGPTTQSPVVQDSSSTVMPTTSPAPFTRFPTTAEPSATPVTKAVTANITLPPVQPTTNGPF